MTRNMRKLVDPCPVCGNPGPAVNGRGRTAGRIRRDALILCAVCRRVRNPSGELTEVPLELRDALDATIRATFHE